MATKRKKTRHSEPDQISFNDASNSYKVVESGHVIESIKGAINAAVEVGKNKPVYVINTAAAWGYVAFGVAGMAAPTGITDGIGVPPNGSIWLSSGTATHIRGSAATLAAYVATETVTDGADQAAV